MKRRLALLFALLLCLCSPVFAADQHITPGQGVEFDQLDFPGNNVTNSSVGMVSVNLLQLRNVTGLQSGYINIDLNGAWVVRNLPVFEEKDFPYSHLSSQFDLSVTPGADVTSLSLGVVYSDDIKTSMPASLRDSFPVGDINYSSGGIGEGLDRNAGGATQPPTMEDVMFGDPANTRAIFQLDHPNIEAADNQCYPMAVANSLQFLEDTTDLEIPHDHKAGLKGDDSLVGQLGTHMNRTVVGRRAPESGTENSGVDDLVGINGKLKYLAANGLSERVQTRHWGLYAGNTNASQSNGAATATSAAQAQQIDFESIVSALEGGEDCEAAYSYTVSGGGHAIDLVAAGYTNGQPWIVESSDIDQDSDSEGAGPSGFIFSHLTDNNDDGYPELSGGEERLDLVICQKYIPPTVSTGTVLPPEGTEVSIPGAELTTDSVTDPAGHSCCVDPPPSILDLFFDNGQVQLSGSGASWLPMTLGIDGMGNISGSNQATVAGFPSINNSITGTMGASGFDATITLGTGGGLPTGAPISYDVTITPQQPWPWSVTTAPASLATAIRANGFRHNLMLPPGDPLSLSLSVTQGSASGTADWWLAVQAAEQFFSYDLASGNWLPGLIPVYQGPLFDLGNTPLISLPSGLPPGVYNFYFGVDMSANGALDIGSLTYDSVTVSVLP
ncbi:MAG: hypothetical protein OET90_05105 [Desulfuromonadales bacterium]|nr:hypothetical protein [Desulfuromonadales bacterium]